MCVCVYVCVCMYVFVCVERGRSVCGGDVGTLILSFILL